MKFSCSCFMFAVSRVIIVHWHYNYFCLNVLFINKPVDLKKIQMNKTNE